MPDPHCTQRFPHCSQLVHGLLGTTLVAFEILSKFPTSFDEKFKKYIEEELVRCVDFVIQSGVILKEIERSSECSVESL